MERYLELLKESPLFYGISKEDLKNILSCLNAKVASYQKNQLIFKEGDPPSHVGIVLSGAVQIIKEDYYGNRNILAHIEVGELFGEVFACANMQNLPVTVLSNSDTRIMLLDCKGMVTSCTNSCHFHSKLIKNLLRILAEKSLILNHKIELLSKRTIREKLLTYLMSQAKKNGYNEFVIPYDRQGLADYLGVERSAMSAEISKMCKDGLIETKKSRFKLL